MNNSLYIIIDNIIMKYLFPLWINVNMVYIYNMKSITKIIRVYLGVHFFAIQTCSIIQHKTVPVVECSLLI